MREAIGGTWLYYIFIVMLIFTVSFLAIFLNYMAAYRANNQVISILEQSEGIMPSASKVSKMVDANFTLGDNSDFKSCTISYGEQSFIIRVAAFMKLEIPLVNVPLKVPVKNETRSISCVGKDGCPSQQVIDSLKATIGYTGDCTESTGW